MFYVVFDFVMAAIIFLFGVWFHKSNGKRMMLMPIPFILGGIIDIQYQGIGCLIAWVGNMVYYVYPIAYGQTEKRKLVVE